jgi:Chalcone isomerase-like
MFRFIVVLIAALLFLAPVVTCADDCKNGVCTNFANHGLEATKKIGGRSYSLISAGMRTKFFLDVYAVGLYMNEDFVSSKKSLIKKATDFEVLSTAGNKGILSSDATVDVYISLKFARLVAKDQMVGGIVGALTGAKNLDSFKDILTKAIGGAGIAISDEIGFAYKGKAGNLLDISYNGKLIGTVKDAADLRKKLLNVYVGPNSVAPEVVSVLKKRFL